MLFVRFPTMTNFSFRMPGMGGMTGWLPVARTMESGFSDSSSTSSPMLRLESFKQVSVSSSTRWLRVAPPPFRLQSYFRLS